MSSYEEADDSQLDRSRVRRQCDRHRPDRDRSHKMKCGIASITPEFLFKKLAILIFICLSDSHLLISVAADKNLSSLDQFKRMYRKCGLNHFFLYAFAWQELNVTYC